MGMRGSSVRGPLVNGNKALTLHFPLQTISNDVRLEFKAINIAKA